MSALGTVGITSLKGVAIAVLLGGVIGTPIAIFAGGDKRTGIERTHDVWAESKLLTSGFALSTQEGSTDFGISFKDSNFFDPKKGMKPLKKSFNDVKMVFEDYLVQKGDLLFSPEEDGFYYLLKKDGRGNQYKLQDGQKVTRLVRGNANWKKNKHIKLSPRTQYGIAMSTIVLETCTFTPVTTSNDTDWSIKMTCYSNTQRNLRFQDAPRVEAILSKENFNEFFGKKK